MKTTFYKMAFLGALVSGVALLAVIGCRPAGSRAQQPDTFSGDPSSEEQFAKVSELILSGLKERNIPSVSIAVVRKGHAIWEQSFGRPERSFATRILGMPRSGISSPRVSERSLADYMKEEVFRPLGMTGTVFNPDPTTPALREHRGRRLDERV